MTRNIAKGFRGLTLVGLALAAGVGSGCDGMSREEVMALDMLGFGLANHPAASAQEAWAGGVVANAAEWELQKQNAQAGSSTVNVNVQAQGYREPSPQQKPWYSYVNGQMITLNEPYHFYKTGEGNSVRGLGQRFYLDPEGWGRIYDANPQLKGCDLDNLPSGVVLKIPHLKR